MNPWPQSTAEDVRRWRASLAEAGDALAACGLSAAKCAAAIEAFGRVWAAIARRERQRGMTRRRRRELIARLQR